MEKSKNERRPLLVLLCAQKDFLSGIGNALRLPEDTLEEKEAKYTELQEAWCLIHRAYLLDAQEGQGYPEPFLTGFYGLVFPLYGALEVLYNALVEQI
ncbi:MAG: hypothetical protein M0Z39_05735 [Actinomycetota bacterium]|jgi:hypothetical protein|nr:hypothetical protein [Actinomycetota bacterium]